MRGRRVGYLLAGGGVAQPVLGAAVAELELLRALLKFSSASITIFSDDPGSLRALHGRRGHGGGAPVQVVHARDIIDAVRSGRIDVLHSSFVQAWRTLQVRELTGRPLAVTAVVHSMGYLDCRIPALKALLLTRRGVDAVICPSRDAAEAVHRVTAAMTRALALPAARARTFRTVVVPHGVDEETFAPGKRASARAALRLPRAAVVLLYAGRLSPWSKMELFPLLVAVQRLVAAGHREVQLVLAGEEQLAGYRAQLVRAARALGIARHLRTVSVSRDDLPQYFAAADVFVSPSDNVQESFGLTLLEAMASGLPVVAAAWNGYKDIVRDGITGYLVPVWAPLPDEAVTRQELARGSEAVLYHVAQTTAVDVDALVDRLLRLVKDARLRAAMGDAGRETVCRLFTWRSVVAAYEAQWEAACRAPRRAARRGRGFYDVDYPGCFGHFASRAFPAAVELTDIGRQFLDPYGPVAGPLLDMASSASLDVVRLRRAVRRAGRADTQAPTPELAFALKHGLVRAAAGRSGRRRPTGGA